MQIDIHHWHRRYRLRTPHVLPYEQLAGGVLASFERHLEAAPQDALWLVRGVRLRLKTRDSGALADQWGRSMAQATLDAMSRQHPEQVRRFENELDYVARFLSALVTGGDADAWHFARLRRQWPGVTRSNLDRIVADHERDWNGLAGCLQRCGALVPVLERVSPRLLARLWEISTFPDAAGPDAPADEALFRAAVSLLSNVTGAVVTNVQRAAWSRRFQKHRPAADWESQAVTHRLLEMLDELWSRQTEFRAAWARRTTTSAHAAQRADDDRRLAETRPWESLLMREDWLDREAVSRWFQQACQTSAALQERVSLIAGAEGPAAADLQQLGLCRTLWGVVGEQFQAQCAGISLALQGREHLALTLMRTAAAGAIDSRVIARFVQTELRAAWSSGRPGDVLPTVRGEQAATAGHAAAGGFRVAAVVPQRPDLPKAGASATNSEGGEATELAGTLILLRSLGDLRLMPLAARVGCPAAPRSHAGELFRQLLSYWSGLQEVGECECLNRFVDRWLELETAGVAAGGLELRASATAFQTTLAERLVRMNVWTDPARLVLSLEMSNGGTRLLRGGDSSGRMQPWVAVVNTWADVRDVGGHWVGELQKWTGAAVFAELPGDDAWIAPVVDSPPNERELSAILEHETCRAAAEGVVRHWARGLPGVAESSTAYLLEQFIRRPGAVRFDGHELVVRLAPRPLDVVLTLSGSVAPLEMYTPGGMLRVAFEFGRGQAEA